MGVAERNGILGVPFLINVHGTAEGRGRTYPIGISQLLETWRDQPQMTAGSDFYLGDLTVENVADLYVSVDLKPLIEERQVLRRGLVLATVLVWGAFAFGNVAGLQVYVVQQAEHFGPQPVDAHPGIIFDSVLGNETRFAKHAQMPAQRLRAHVYGLRDFAGAPGFLQQQADYFAPRGVGQRAECRAQMKFARAIHERRAQARGLRSRCVTHQRCPSGSRAP